MWWSLRRALSVVLGCAGSLASRRTGPLCGPRCGLRCEVSLSIAWRGGPMVVVTAPDQFVSALSFVTLLCLYKSKVCLDPCFQSDSPVRPGAAPRSALSHRGPTRPPTVYVGKCRPPRYGMWCQ